MEKQLNFTYSNHVAEEDYIDMDTSSTTFLGYTLPSPPPHSREFEFQMSIKNLQTIDHITSPADELFYKGKLLPLHLPPRIEMVEKILQNSSFNNSFAINTNTSTPFESCNISPATSCYVSGELNLEDYSQLTSPAEFVKSQTKKSWSKKFKLIKQSSLSIKLKASKAYLKSLFTKPGCSYETAAVHKAKQCSSGYTTTEKTKRVEGECGHRRSFSIKRKASNKSSSASSSSRSSSKSSSFSSVNSRNSTESYGPQMLKRSSSVGSENECSVQGAIAYCKKSQQQAASVRKNVSDVEFYLLSGSRLGVETR